MLLDRTFKRSLNAISPHGHALSKTSCTRHLKVGRRTLHSVRAVSRTVPVYFTEEAICIEAQPKENIVEVAERAGISIETGCNSGSCGTCEVEVRKFGDGDMGREGAPMVVRACIAAIPPGFSRIEIAPLSDQIWGSDGWDT